jgi:hypothetical protein
MEIIEAGKYMQQKKKSEIFVAIIMECLAVIS